jgi:hypothetical protein
MLFLVDRRRVNSAVILPSFSGGTMKFFGLAFAFLSISTSGQTANDLNTKYGVAQKSYEIRPGIFMTPKFSSDGRVCEMSVEKRHVKSSGAILVDDTFMSREEMTPIVEELVPFNERGTERKPSGDISIIGGGMTTTYDYENVRVTYFGNVVQRDRRSKDIVTQGTAAVVIQWKNRGCN